MWNHWINIHMMLSNSLDNFLFTLFLAIQLLQAYLNLLIAAWHQVLLNNLLSHLVKVEVHNLYYVIQLILAVGSAIKQSYRCHQLFRCESASSTFVNAFEFVMLTEVVGASWASLWWKVGWIGGSRRCTFTAVWLACEAKELLILCHLLDHAFLSCFFVCIGTVDDLSLPLLDLPEPLVDLLLAQAKLCCQFLAHFSTRHLSQVFPQGLLE